MIYIVQSNTSSCFAKYLRLYIKHDIHVVRNGHSSYRIKCNSVFLLNQITNKIHMLQLQDSES